MNTNMKNTVESFDSLVFFPMTVPSTGCIATGRLPTGHDITVTGGNTNQQADGHSTFLVEVIKRDKVIIKRNVSRDELAFIIEHYRRAVSRKKTGHHRHPAKRYHSR